MKRFISILVSVVVVLPAILAGCLLFDSALASADPAYNPAYLISDPIFTDTSTMSVSSIQSFLVSENSGLQSYSDVENCNPPTPTLPDPYSASYYPHCGSSESAATIIYDAGQAYGINPRTIMATLQKEQSLITTPNPTQSQLNCAMGYRSCASGYLGFFNQVDNGAWQFRDYIELMSNRNWWGHTPASYPCANASSLYSTGLYPGNTVTFTNPGGLAQTITLGDASTAALYCYTPYVGPYSLTGYSGSYNFVVSFETWFGSVASPCYNSTNLSGTGTGIKVVPNKYSPTETDGLALTLLNNTGSACAEVHTWNPGQQSFYSDVATNLPVADPADGEIISADLFGNGMNELIFVKYLNTGSGNIEVHIWNPGEQTWYQHIATTLPSSYAANGYVIAADMYGNGQDELVYVEDNNTGSGDLELHVWNPGEQTWSEQIATTLPLAEAANGYVIDANIDGQDRLVFVKDLNTGSGDIEVHVWNPGEQTWYAHIATNLSSADAPNGKVIGIDDKLAFIKYTNTGSGHIEVHTWNPGEQTWYSHVATNY